MATQLPAQAAAVGEYDALDLPDQWESPEDLALNERDGERAYETWESGGDFGEPWEEERATLAAIPASPRPAVTARTPCNATHLYTDASPFPPDPYRVPLPVDDGRPYDEFDDGPQNKAREERHWREQAAWPIDPLELARIPWAQRAEELAIWVWRWLVNRIDAWGAYRPEKNRDDGKTYTAPALSRRGQVFLTIEKIAEHFAGADVRDIIGLHAIGIDVLGEFSRWVGFDFDQHQVADPAAGDANLVSALKLCATLRALGLNPLLFKSDGKGGYHVWVILDRPIAAAIAFAFARGMAAEIIPGCKLETFPKQAALSGEKYGSLMRLPGRHHTRPFFTEVYIDGKWASGHAAIDFILATTGTDAGIVERKVGHAAGHHHRQHHQHISTATTASATPVGNWLRSIIGLIPMPHLDLRHDWIKLGIIIRDQLPTAEGLEIWDAISRTSMRYTPGCCVSRWDGLPTSGAGATITLATVIFWIREQRPKYNAPRRPIQLDASNCIDVSMPRFPTR